MVFLAEIVSYIHFRISCVNRENISDIYHRLGKRVAKPLRHSPFKAPLERLYSFYTDFPYSHTDTSILLMAKL